MAGGGCRVLGPEGPPGPGNAAPGGCQAAALDLGDLPILVALQGVQEQRGGVLRRQAAEDRLDVLALWDRRMAIRRLRLVPGAGELRQVDPLEALAAAQLVDRRVVRDAIEPREHPLIARETGQRAECLGERLLHDVV